MLGQLTSTKKKKKNEIKSSLDFELTSTHTKRKQKEQTNCDYRGLGALQLLPYPLGTITDDSDLLT